MEKEIQTECSEISSLELQMTANCSGVKHQQNAQKNISQTIHLAFYPTILECIKLAADK